MDAYGHVNNGVYLTYLEECRDAWAQHLFGGPNRSWDFVLAHIGIDYRSQLTQADGEIVVRCRLASLRPFECSYARGDPEGRRDARGRGRGGGRPARPRRRSIASAHRARTGVAAGRARTRRDGALGRLVGEHPATVHEVISVPAVADPHDRHAARRARGVQRPPVADERVDVIDPAVTVTVVEHQIAGLELVVRQRARPSPCPRTFVGEASIPRRDGAARRSSTRRRSPARATT